MDILRTRIITLLSLRVNTYKKVPRLMLLMMIIILHYILRLKRLLGRTPFSLNQMPPLDNDFDLASILLKAMQILMRNNDGQTPYEVADVPREDPYEKDPIRPNTIY